MSEKEIADLKEEINNNTELTREFNRKRKKEIIELQEWNEKTKTILGRVLSKLFKKFFTLNRNALINTRLTKKQIEEQTTAFIKILTDDKINREILQEHYKQRIEKSDWAIECITNPKDKKEKSMVDYIKDDLEFYKKQLNKLNRGGKNE